MATEADGLSHAKPCRRSVIHLFSLLLPKPATKSYTNKRANGPKRTYGVQIGHCHTPNPLVNQQDDWRKKHLIALEPASDSPPRPQLEDREE